MTPTRPLDAALVAAKVRDAQHLWANARPYIEQAIREQHSTSLGPSLLEAIVLIADALAHRDAQLAAAEEKLTTEEGFTNRYMRRLHDAERQLVAVRAVVDTYRGKFFGFVEQLVRELEQALRDPGRVAPVDRLTPEQRKYIEYIRTQLTPVIDYEDEMLAILDQHCPPPTKE